jgi:catechol 2,3-dioxygenase-like lactoylglutathione lyase family enzyme
MKLGGIHHLTVLSADIDRLAAFYERVFEAPKTLDMEEDGLRHVYIQLGPATVLHPFEVPGIDVPQGEIPMFQRGRMDHIGLHAESEESFWELRRRVLAEGAAVDDAVVSDMGSLISFTFEDPDGLRHEVIWERPGELPEATLPRAEWTTADDPSA